MGSETPARVKEQTLPPRWFRILRGAIMVYVGLQVALALRATGHFWGLPNSQHYFSYHPDEIFLLLPSFGFARGDWNPHYFSYGTLYIYLVGIPAVLSGTVPTLAQFPSDLRPLYELGRAVSTWMGVASVAVLYLALWRRDRRLAFLSALFLALCPLHAVNSQYATVDVPATFWLALAFWLALWGADRPSARRGVLVGLAVGLAAATKYNAVLFLVPALAVPLLVRPRVWRWGWCGAVVGGAVLGFMIGCPFFWTPDFLRSVLSQVRYVSRGGTLAFVGTGSGWVYHLTRGLPVGLGYALLAAVVLGIPVAIVSPSRPLRLSLLWVVFYLAAIGFGKEQFIRYLVPLTPFVCVLAAGGLLWLMPPSRRRALRLAGAVCIVAVGTLTGLYCAIKTMQFVEPRDARDVAWAMLTPADRLRPSGGPQGEPPLRMGLQQSPWFFHPPVSPYNSGPFLRSLFEEWNERTGRHVVVTGWDVEKLRAERPDVFFLSDLESRDLLRLRDPAATAFVAALGELYPQRREFGVRSGGADWLAPPRSWAPPDWLYPDAHITIYYGPRRKEP